MRMGKDRADLLSSPSFEYGHRSVNLTIFCFLTDFELILIFVAGRLRNDPKFRNYFFFLIFYSFV